MRVPKALLDKCEGLKFEADKYRESVSSAQAGLDIAETKLKICLEAIALVEEAKVDPDDVAIFQPTLSPPPEEVRQLAPMPGPHSPGLQMRRQLRRNIKEMVAAELMGFGVGSPGKTERMIAVTIGVQVPQVKGALAKLAGENLAFYSLSSNRWYWNEEAPTDVSRVDETQKPAANALAEEAAPISLVEYLEVRPEGVSHEELVDLGYDVNAAVRYDRIWIDARGFYHATTQGPEEAKEEAAE